VNNGGCSGGIFSSPYQYIEANGISLYDSYPYDAKVGTCQSFVDKAVRISSYEGIHPCDVKAVKSALQVCFARVRWCT
jgi:hypothetical protein